MARRPASTRPGRARSPRASEPKKRPLRSMRRCPPSAPTRNWSSTSPVHPNRRSRSSQRSARTGSTGTVRARADAPDGVGNSRGETCCTRPSRCPSCMTPMTAARWPSTGSCRIGWSREPSKARRCSASCSRVEHTRVSMRWVRLCWGDQCQRFFTTTGRATSAVAPGGRVEVAGVPSPTRVASSARTSLSVAAPTTDAAGWATGVSRRSRWWVSAAIQSSPEPTTTAYPPSRVARRTPATKAAGSPVGRGTTCVRVTAREAPTRPAPGREDPTPTRQPARCRARAAVTAPRSRVCARISTEAAGLPADDMRRPYAPAAPIRGRIAAAARGGISPTRIWEPAPSPPRRAPGRLDP